MMSESERRIDQIRAATLNDFFYLPQQVPILKCFYILINSQIHLDYGAQIAMNLFKLKAFLKNTLLVA